MYMYMLYTYMYCFMSSQQNATQKLKFNIYYSNTAV